MPEGFVNQTLETATGLGITAVASATLLQTRLLASLPDELSGRFPGCETNAQRAIQFTRSTPGVSVALVGMSRAAHVAENLAIAKVRPMAREAYLPFYA
jgi:predicted aldo/keto reductase-like oxidoreductase